jgi:hypothetical protein
MDPEHNITEEEEVKIDQERERLLLEAQYSKPKNKIPEWSFCSAKFVFGFQLNPLEQYIYDNEPTGKTQSQLFREELQKLVDYLR